MAESILIVDDEVPILNSLSKILEDEGYDVTVAKSGTEALKLMTTEPPDLLLLDIWMPEMDGLETLRRAREQAPRVPVMMMSGHGSIETAVKAIKLVARAIHQQSPRREHAFVAVNCAAIPENLIESELFGHERGAFTGATAQKRGQFEQADGGTLFLDEIGDMSLSTQAKVLRALEE